jgi:hypothetical protein
MSFETTKADDFKVSLRTKYNMSCYRWESLDELEREIQMPLHIKYTGQL